MAPHPTHDLPTPHFDGQHHRKEAAPKPKEMKPLWTHEPLSHDRERKPAAPPKKRRKHVVPATSALSFDPKRNHVPSGRQDTPVSPSVYSRSSTSESSASSFDEQQTTPYDQLYNGSESQKWPRIFPDCPPPERSASFYPGTPYTDTNDVSSVPPDFHDSPVSCTSSSPPDPPDRSPCVAGFPVQVIDYAHPVQPMYAYGGQVYVQQPAVHQVPYGYPMGPCPDRPIQGYSMQYSDAAYGRPAPHGLPAYPDNDGCPYPTRKY